VRAGAAPAIPVGGPPAWLWAVSLLLVGLAGFVVARSGRRTRAVATLAAICLIAVLWTGCGGFEGTTQGVYNVTVTATSGSSSQTINLGLTIR
jgi:apolipoprotein N-acyltransferase